MPGSLQVGPQGGWVWSMWRVARSEASLKTQDRLERCENIPELPFFLEITSMNSEQLSADHLSRKDEWIQNL